MAQKNWLVALADKFLVDDWRNSLKFISLWVYGLIALSPDLWAIAVQYKLVSGTVLPEVFTDLIRTIAGLGAMSRLINQRLGKFPLFKSDSDVAEGDDDGSAA